MRIKDNNRKRRLIFEYIKARVSRQKERCDELDTFFEGDERSLLDAFADNLKVTFNRNLKKYRNEDVQEYFHNLVAAFMLEYKEAYENYAIEVPYRIKSERSTFLKILKYLQREDKSSEVVADNGATITRLKDDLTDMLAIRVVRMNRTSKFYSNDPELVDLIEEKRINYALLNEMERFQLRDILEEEFPGREPSGFKNEASRENYYLHCMFLIERTRSLIHPNAVALMKMLDTYEEIIRQRVPKVFYDTCKNSIMELNKPENKGKIDTPNNIYYERKAIWRTLKEKLTPAEYDYMHGKITDEEIKKVNFNHLLNFFSARVSDKLDLAVLKRQVYSVFDKSDLLKRFGVTLDKDSEKEKRTEDGYVADFIIINTPFGKVEMQLQTQHEYEEGNYGYAAHSDMEGKSFEEIPIPNPEDASQLRGFLAQVEFTSPLKFLAEYDHAEKERVRTQIFDSYENYKSIVTQVKKGSKEERKINQYFDRLYDIRGKVFRDDAARDHFKSFVEADIYKYLRSDKFKALIQSFGKGKDKKPKSTPDAR